MLLFKTDATGITGLGLQYEGMASEPRLPAAITDHRPGIDRIR